MRSSSAKGAPDECVARFASITSIVQLVPDLAMSEENFQEGSTSLRLRSTVYSHCSSSHSWRWTASTLVVHEHAMGTCHTRESKVYSSARNATSSFERETFLTFSTGLMRCKAQTLTVRGKSHTLASMENPSTLAGDWRVAVAIKQVQCISKRTDFLTAQTIWLDLVGRGKALRAPALRICSWTSDGDTVAANLASSRLTAEGNSRSSTKPIRLNLMSWISARSAKSSERIESIASLAHTLTVSLIEELSTFKISEPSYTSSTLTPPQINPCMRLSRLDLPYPSWC